MHMQIQFSCVYTRVVTHINCIEPVPGDGATQRNATEDLSVRLVCVTVPYIYTAQVSKWGARQHHVVHADMHNQQNT